MIGHFRRGADEPFGGAEVNWLLNFACYYLIASFAVVGFIVRDLGAITTPAAVGGSMFFYFIRDVLAGILPVLAALVFLIGWQRLKLRAGALVRVFVACIIMQTGFFMMKTTFPMILPFYADPFFAELDLAIHGVDPWVWAHGLIGMEQGQTLFSAYTRVWSVWALFFPLILVLVDSDRARVKRFMILFLAAWIVLGNVVALSGLSVGPVFYDRLLGGARFAGLTETLEAGGMGRTVIGITQDALWRLYAEGSNAIGPGISAFPSVHVAVASVAALYLAERSRWLAIPGFGYLALILFLSVYTGYHYAVDGYASILVIGGLWAALRWHAARGARDPAGAMTPAE